MSDHPGRRSRRPDSKTMWDESDRRTAGRDRDQDRDRRDDRNDRRRDDRGDRGRRYRSRSRDRRDRRRSRSRDRDRDYTGRGDRDYGRDRRDRGAGRRDEPYASRGGGGRGDRTRGGGDRPPSRRAREGDEPKRDTNHRRSASPETWKSPDELELEHKSPLPSRPKNDNTNKNGAPGGGVPHGAPVSFKVGGQENGGGSKSIENTPDDYDRGDGEPMEEDRYDQGRRAEDEEDEDEDEVVVEDEGMAAMQAMMGFGGFDTTKHKKVIGNNAGGVRKEKKTEYRQYMNRIGGFNRPLSPGR